MRADAKQKDAVVSRVRLHVGKRPLEQRRECVARKQREGAWRRHEPALERRREPECPPAHRHLQHTREDRPLQRGLLLVVVRLVRLVLLLQ